LVDFRGYFFEKNFPLNQVKNLFVNKGKERNKFLYFINKQLVIQKQFLVAFFAVKSIKGVFQ